jgi:ribosomal-protein-serine acetyltransferase
MTLSINQNIRLVLIAENHAEPIFNMVETNRTFLRTWLPFVDKMQSVDFAKGFVKGTMDRNQLGIEYAFIIFDGEEAIGRIGVYKIDNQNHIGEIGYWLVENKQGKGIITQACQTLIGFCFDTLKLNRIELKCGTANSRSLAIPERLSFVKEGIIRQGEWLHDRYIDLYLFSLLKADWKRLATEHSPD